MSERQFKCHCGWTGPESETLWRPVGLTAESLPTGNSERIHEHPNGYGCGPVVEQPATEEVMQSENGSQSVRTRNDKREDGRVKGASQRYVERMFGQPPADDTPDVPEVLRDLLDEGPYSPLELRAIALAQRVAELEAARSDLMGNMDIAAAEIQRLDRRAEKAERQLEVAKLKLVRLFGKTIAAPLLAEIDKAGEEKGSQTPDHA